MENRSNQATGDNPERKSFSSQVILGKQDLYAAKMLVADLKKLNTDIFTVEQLGLTRSMETFGCTRSKLDSWRQYSIKLKEELTETKKRDDLESTSIVDAYRANVKLTKLPKITKKSWPKWFMRWNQEEKYLKDEWAKFTTIEGCLNEKEAGKQLRTSDALLGHLTYLDVLTSF